jgi:hypothetical protein
MGWGGQRLYDVIFDESLVFFLRSWALNKQAVNKNSLLCVMELR